MQTRATITGSDEVVSPFGLTTVFLAMLFAAFASAQADTDKKLKGPYCGPVAVYTAAKLFNKPVEFLDLINEKYIGSREGSSLNELTHALEDVGLFALPVEKYTKGQLTELDSPVILHVRKENQAAYNHYILYLGSEGDDAILFDYPGFQRMPFYRLRAIWNGNGIIVSDVPINLAALKRKQYLLTIVKVVLAAAVVFVIKALQRRMKVRGRLRGHSLFESLAIQGVLIVSLSGMLAIPSSWFSDGGLLAQADATSPIKRLHIADFLPRVDKDKLQKILGAGDGVIIDARLVFDYQDGHIEGAINIPVTMEMKEMDGIISSLNKDAPVVVYCQSTGCAFAETVAARLSMRGFTNLFIYPEGWTGWTAKDPEGV